MAHHQEADNEEDKDNLGQIGIRVVGTRNRASDKYDYFLCVVLFRELSGILSIIIEFSEIRINHQELIIEERIAF